MCIYNKNMEVKNNIKNILPWLWHIFGIVFAFYITLFVFFSAGIISLFFDLQSNIIDTTLFFTNVLCASLFSNYLINKFFDTFKFLDKKIENVFLKLFFLFAISAFCTILLLSNRFKFENLHNICFDFYLAFLSVFSYLLYKFFNFLTLKFPKPFKKIGYFCSLKCYKKIFRKIVKKLKEKYGKK